MSVLTSSNSAAIHQKVALHLREFFECTKVLLQIKKCIMYHLVSHLWHADVQKTFRINIDSLISNIEDKRGQFSTPKFEKLAHCMLKKLKAKISSHEHPYKIDISRDVEILYEHSLGSRLLQSLQSQGNLQNIAAKVVVVCSVQCAIGNCCSQ
jgi:hypothetical protein